MTKAQFRFSLYKNHVLDKKFHKNNSHFDIRWDTLKPFDLV